VVLVAAKIVRLTLAKVIALANLKRAERGQKAISMNALASEIGVAATTGTRLARTDDKAASSLPLDLAGASFSPLVADMNSLNFS
jgi:hypothetical protein